MGGDRANNRQLELAILEEGIGWCAGGLVPERIEMAAHAMGRQARWRILQIENGNARWLATAYLSRQVMRALFRS